MLLILVPFPDMVGTDHISRTISTCALLSGSVQSIWTYFNTQLLLVPSKLLQETAHMSPGISLLWEIHWGS